MLDRLEELGIREDTIVFFMSDNGMNMGHHDIWEKGNGPTCIIRTQEWKYIHRCPYGPDELYHLTEDPEENKNVIDAPEYASIADSLHRRLTDWFYTCADPALDASKEGVTGFGQLCRPGIYADRRKVFYCF